MSEGPNLVLAPGFGQGSGAAPVINPVVALPAAVGQSVVLAGAAVPVSTVDRTVQLLDVFVQRDDKRGEDGSAWYLVLSVCEQCKTNPGHHNCVEHPGMVHEYERQGFRRGEFGHRLDATPEEIATGRANLWGWDGDAAAPTLTPSFLAKTDRPYVMHSFLTRGRLELCGDSTVRLHPSPRPCEEWVR